MNAIDLSGNSEVCAWNEHNGCSGFLTAGVCTCLCHFMTAGDRFQIRGVSFIKIDRFRTRLLLPEEKRQ